MSDAIEALKEFDPAAYQDHEGRWLSHKLTLEDCGSIVLDRTRSLSDTPVPALYPAKQLLRGTGELFVYVPVEGARSRALCLNLARQHSSTFEAGLRDLVKEELSAEAEAPASDTEAKG